MNWECPEASNWALDIMRKNDPFQEITQADLRWLQYGENHLGTFPQYPQGIFTLRMTTTNARRYPTLDQALAAGKTHHLHAFNDRKRPVEGEERQLNAFLVDLRVASMALHHAAEERTNPTDGHKYLIFDPMDPHVRNFCRQLRI